MKQDNYIFFAQSRAAKGPAEISTRRMPANGVFGCAGVAGRSKLVMMSSLKEIEDAVVKLSEAELAAFRDWFAEFDANAWDRQIEEDILAGRLDALADKAIEDLLAGRCTDRWNIALMRDSGKVSVGGIDVPVLEVSTVPGSVMGIYQVTVQLPSDDPGNPNAPAPAGNAVSLDASADDVHSQPGVTIAIGDPAAKPAANPSKRSRR
jgi:hypothetical protein